MTPTHNEFFIEKEQLPVEITMVTGESMEGLLFVQPGWRRPSLEFDAPTILHVHDAFFPVQLTDGTTRLIAKAHVVLMRGRTAESENGEGVYGDPAQVSITCVNGARVNGKLLITRMAPNMRVLDFLNRSTDEFIPVHEGETTVLVNRRLIILVTDESHGAA